MFLNSSPTAAEACSEAASFSLITSLIMGGKAWTKDVESGLETETGEKREGVAERRSKRRERGARDTETDSDRGGEK